MRHDGRADDADGEIEHLGIAHDFYGRGEPRDDGAHIGLRHRDLDGEADAGYGEQCYDKGLDPAEAYVLEVEDQEDIESGDEYADLERNAEQKIEADGGADDFG